MSSYSEEDKRLFQDAQQEISHNVKSMMEELWLNWSHLGIDQSTKSERIRNLVLIERELHRDVIKETEQKLKALHNEVDKLKEESKQLSQYLSMEITLQEFTDDVFLSDYKKLLEDQIIGLKKKFSTEEGNDNSERWSINKFSRYRKQVEQRKITIKRLSEWQRDLCDSLGVSAREVQEMPLPSEEELDILRRHLDLLQEEKDKRTAVFLDAQREIKDIMDSLSLKPIMKFEALVVESMSVDFKVTDRNMERLAELLQSMRDQMHDTNNRVLELRERLGRVWEVLEEDRVYRSNFLQAHRGCGPATEKAIRDEIARCECIKKQKIQVFVSNIRTKIKLLWDECLYSELERQQFVYYYQDVFSEDTLTLHELYHEELAKFYNDHKQIFEMVATRQMLWEKMLSLEGLASNPGRYQNRGGQLLQEEKQRKAISAKLPKIEKELKEMVLQYEAATGKTFTVNGKPLLQIMADDWEARHTEKVNKMSARKQALTPNTPLLRSLAVSPLGKRNRTAAGLATGACAAAGAERAPPAKRPLVTASASKLVAATRDNLSALKRSAVSTIKRRISGRVAARAAETQGQGKERTRRKLMYEANAPRIAVNGSILKHKRTSHGKRRSSSRRSLQAGSRTSSSQSHDEQDARPQVADSTMLTSYTDFKEHINENTFSRSSLAVRPAPSRQPAAHRPTPHEVTQKKTPASKAFTPKLGKENIKNGDRTPSPVDFQTPLRATRSGVKGNVFLTPRAPLSAAKTNVPKQLTPAATKTPSTVGRASLLQRQHTVVGAQPHTTPTGLGRSKTSHALRVRNLPPII